MQPQMQQLPPTNGMIPALQRPNPGFNNMPSLQHPYPTNQLQQQQQAPQQQQFQLTSPPPLISSQAFNKPPAFLPNNNNNFSQQGTAVPSSQPPQMMTRPPVNDPQQFQNFQPQTNQFQPGANVFQHPQPQAPLVNNPNSNLADQISNLSLSGAPSMLAPPSLASQNRNESPLSFSNQMQPPQMNNSGPPNQFALNSRPTIQRPLLPPSGQQPLLGSQPQMTPNQQIPPMNQFQPPSQFQPPNPSNQFQPPPSNQFQPPNPSNQFQPPPSNQFQPPNPSNQFQPPNPSNQFQPPPSNQFQPQQMNHPILPPQTGQPPFYQQPGQFNPQQQQPPPAFDQYSQQHQQQQPQQQQQNRIDMDQIPNPIEVMQANNTKYGGEIFETNEAGKMPPLTSTDFICRDMGNCNPRFIRSSIYSVPINPDLLKQSKLPIALNLTPFAELRAEENEPPISDLGELGPVRCKRCKAYMSPFMVFIDSGKRFQCPFCEDVTQVPQEYFNHLDHMGKRVDLYERPELCCGSYEFVATKDYCRNQTLPTPPAFIFMIDVSVNSVRSGLLHILCPYIKNVILPNLPRDLNSIQQNESNQLRVGFVTYDKELHFYNLKSTLAAPQMMIVSDIDEVFVPILDGFLVNLNESRQVIETLLDTLPAMFQENKETELVLAPVVEAGIEALKSAKCAGKLFIFHSNLPNAMAPGQLKSRDDKKLLGTEKEKTILSAQTEYYAQLGKKCVENGCSVDLFLLPNQYCDVATLSDLTRKTSGQIYKYDFFQADSHGKRLCDDLKYAIDSTIAFDAVMKIRTSTGIKPIDYLGNFNLYGNDIELAGLQRQSSLSVELKHEDKLNENSKVFIQLALLYTSLSGQRRIRLHNLSLSVSTQYSQMFASCELDTLINYMAKLACRSVSVSNPKSIRENLISQVANILACYRKNCTNSPSKGQFILPETLKLLPVFSNSLLKSDAIAGGQNITTDERSWQMFRLMSMDIKSTYVYFYPRLMSVNEIESPNQIPAQMRCLLERLKEDNIYLLENGLSMYLWIGANVDPAQVQNLFGVQNIQQLNVEKCKILEIDTPISINIRSVINTINDQRKISLKLIVVRQRDSLEVFFKNFLVEDKGFNAQSSSYVEFLHYLHREVKNILS